MTENTQIADPDFLVGRMSGFRVRSWMDGEGWRASSRSDLRFVEEKKRKIPARNGSWGGRTDL